MDFSHKWVKKAVCKLLGKEAVDESDLAKIKYLAIGESFQNDDFFIEISLEEPPKPFVNTDGGDEWAVCLRGDDIAKLTEKFKGEMNIRLSMFGLYRKDEEWQKYCYSYKAKMLWRKFTESVVKEIYYAEHEDDEFDEWYDGVCASLWRDLALFTGVEVLRLQGLKIPDLTFLEKFTNLWAAELVETKFVSTDGIEILNRLEQLACWLD